MGIGLHVGDIYYEIGTGDYLHSFFSSVSCHLEPGGWGTEYPFLMNELYSGTLRWEEALTVMEEIQAIRERLRLYGPSEVIWDIDDLALRPPWGEDISSDITSLADYYVTSDGKDLIDVLLSALLLAYTEKQNLEIK